jgi:hypothetical protein
MPGHRGRSAVLIDAKLLGCEVASIAPHFHAPFGEANGLEGCSSRRNS